MPISMVTHIVSRYGKTLTLFKRIFIVISSVWSIVPQVRVGDSGGAL